MNKKVMFLLLMGFMTSTLCAFAHTRVAQTDFLQQSRIYVQADQIHVTPEGLFVEIAGNFYQAAQISQDENGFYIPHAKFWVKCPRGHPNPPWRLTCQVCGVPLSIDTPQ